MKMIARILIPIIVITIGLSIMMFLKSFRKTPPKRLTPERIVSMTVKKASFGPVNPEISVLARVRARDRVNLSAEAGGRVLVKEFKLRRGISFNRGDILVQIDNETAKNTLKVHIGNLMSGIGEMLPDMKIDMPQDFQRWHTFFESLSFSHIPPLPEYQSEKEKMYLTRFNIFTLYYNSRNQQEMVNKYTIRAPFKGLVSEARVHPGDMANPGFILAVLISTEKYELELPLSQSELAYIKKGMNVDVVISENGFKTRGTIVRVSPTLDVASQTAIAIVEVSGSKAVVDGAYGEMKIKGIQLPRALIIPRQALYQKNYALVINNVEALKKGAKVKQKTVKERKDLKQIPNLLTKDSSGSATQVGTMEIRSVTAAFVDRKYAYIIEGIEEGELVVIEPTQNVSVGMKVTPILTTQPKG